MKKLATVSYGLPGFLCYWRLLKLRTFMTLGLSVRLDWIRPGREFVKSFSLFPTFLNIHKAYPLFQTGYRRIGRTHFILPGEEKGEGLRKHSLWGQAGMAIWTPALETTGKMLLQKPWVTHLSNGGNNRTHFMGSL